MPPPTVLKARGAIKDPKGPQGPPGEVTSRQLSDAIAGTSANRNGVQTLDTTFGDPDDESLRQKLNELINVLRR